MLADVANLGEDERAMLANVAPVMQDATLTAIERAFQRADQATLKKSAYLAPLLRSLSYDSAHFERAVGLLIKLAQVTDTEAARENDVASMIVSLFQIALSGTHAPVAMRLKVLQGLLESNSAELRAIGVEALDAMLKTDHFLSAYDFDFGARSRDYGYDPPTGEDVQNWFNAVMAFASPLALSDGPVAAEVRKRIAGEFRGLWTNAGQAYALERLATEIAAKGFWPEGWIAARQTLIFERKRLPANMLARLTALIELLRPKDLVDQVRGVVLGSGSRGTDLDGIDDIGSEDFSGAAARMNAAVENLGKAVATDTDALTILLPRLVRGSPRVRLFGAGLGSGTEKPYEVWQALLTEFGATQNADVRVIGGFLNGLQRRDAPLTDRLLDEALEHPGSGVTFLSFRQISRLMIAASNASIAPLNLGSHP